MFLVKPEYFNKTIIIKGLITAILLSAFIYLEYLNFNFKILNTFLGLLGLYFLITIPKNSLIYAGFFTGIFWFYWIANSFFYYEVAYLIPFVILGFGFIIAFLFYFTDFVIRTFRPLYCLVSSYFSPIIFNLVINKKFLRICAIFALSFIEPFNFNWFKLELLFIDSYLQTSKIAFILILLAVFLLTEKLKYKFLAIIPLLFAFDYNPNLKIKEPNLKIYMSKINIKQDQKWLKQNQHLIVNKNINEIDKAIDLNYDLVILPETTLPLLLNKDEFLMQYLKEKSQKIDIVIGAMSSDEKGFYNSSFFFSKEKVVIANKVVLVPFGEEIPLSSFLTDLINKWFYNGAQDYIKAVTPTDFNINGYKFRSAICYEATTNKIFENINDTKYMIAISNNAWFTPSIEPILQKLLMKYYAKKYNVIIYHVANGSENYIIKP
ncbi:apolipoprotein N-acyltransferase [Malaciobacter mytili]|uniref:Apolipoprotein N-acyltransferase n=1 Tax=Malaciobacter mytili LMG 24559 TaxID=1032238 RepID=A0AAX2AKH4_9BACT|nr:apolipoprotein N-acyltransferase [Malaciobacter mytili]AXH14100.1 apolipoprotein N-acyltransferase [Malaciobacter mytili LMG 24559]RXK16977.1 apolipoprotein N-acyltransferase [Malaciobacter mytili LMG 24559]